MKASSVRSVLLGIGVLGFCAFLSYGFTRRVLSAGAPDKGSLAPPIQSGRHLVAFVLVSSRCGFCTERKTREALGDIRSSLNSRHASRYSKVLVIGVAIDDEIEQGIRYLRSLGSEHTAFDEIMVGGGWLNELIAELVWKRGVATAEVPQVILVERVVDATAYPRSVSVQADSVIHMIRGRNSLLDWMKHGTPLRESGVSP